MARRLVKRSRIAWCAGALSVVVTASGCAQAIDGRPVLSPAAFVIQSAKDTLKQKTAALILSGKLNVAGQSATIHGQGKADLTANSIEMTMGFSLGDTAASIRELFVGGNIYMAITAGGQSMKQATGKDWVEIPIGANSGSTSLTSGNPLSALSTLQQQGATVKSLGTSTIRGLTVQGYAVTVSRAAAIKGAEKFLKSSGLSASQQQLAIQAMQNTPVPTQNVWFDTKQHLVRRMSIVMGVALGATAQDGTITIDFVSYGIPVSGLTTPKPSDVLSFKDFVSGTH